MLVLRLLWANRLQAGLGLNSVQSCSMEAESPQLHLIMRQDFAARACKVWKSTCAVAASQNGWNCSASISVWTYRCVCYLRWQLQSLCRLLAGNHTNLLRNRYVAGEERNSFSDFCTASLRACLFLEGKKNTQMKHKTPTEALCSCWLASMGYFFDWVCIYAPFSPCNFIKKCDLWGCIHGRK